MTSNYRNNSMRWGLHLAILAGAVACMAWGLPSLGQTPSGSAKDTRSRGSARANGANARPQSGNAGTRSQARDRAALAEPETSEASQAAVPEGDSQPMAAGGQDLLSIIQSGGLLMIPILICSFLLVLFSLERAVALRRSRVIPKPFVKRFLHQLKEGSLDRDEALTLCDENNSPVATIFAAAVRKWGKPSVEVEQAIIDSGERAIHGLRRYLRIFNAIATLGPLLGLLGTVFGMIECFNTLAAAQELGRPEMLASGISQALVTTAAGLTVAIPAIIGYMYFISRVDRLIIEMDTLGQELVGLISADADRVPRPKGMRLKKQEANA